MNVPARARPDDGSQTDAGRAQSATSEANALKEGEEIDLDLHVRVGTGKENAVFSKVAAVCRDEETGLSFECIDEEDPLEKLDRAIDLLAASVETLRASVESVTPDGR